MGFRGGGSSGSGGAVEAFGNGSGGFSSAKGCVCPNGVDLAESAKRPNQSGEYVDTYGNEMLVIKLGEDSIG